MGLYLESYLHAVGRNIGQPHLDQLWAFDSFSPETIFGEASGRCGLIGQDWGSSPLRKQGPSTFGGWSTNTGQCHLIVVNQPLEGCSKDSSSCYARTCHGPGSDAGNFAVVHSCSIGISCLAAFAVFRPICLLVGDPPPPKSQPCHQKIGFSARKKIVQALEASQNKSIQDWASWFMSGSRSSCLFLKHRKSGLTLPTASFSAGVGNCAS